MPVTDMRWEAVHPLSYVLSALLPIAAETLPSNEALTGAQLGGCYQDSDL